MMFDFRIQPPGYDQGIYRMSFDQYVKIPALNSSKLKGLKKSPAHFVASLSAKQPQRTAAQKMTLAVGKAFDKYMLSREWGPPKSLGDLEKDDLSTYVSVDPGWNKNSNKWKDWAKAQGDKIILSGYALDSLSKMLRNARQSDQFGRLFKSGHAHPVLVWQCRRTGLWCKAELDWITTSGILVDLKTTADASVGFFRRSVYRFGYLHQLAHYLEGLTTVTGIYHNQALLAAVETVAPYGCQVFEPSQAQLIDAGEDNLQRMNQLLSCLETNNWPGFPDLIVDLDTGVYKEEIDA